MPRREDIKKILVIGSGPIIIGQAAEFDYAGTQACQSLKEEGYEVILINSNPATIMTDTVVADRVYIEPLTLDFASRIIYKERPDAILGSLGGQTGLNLVVELAETGILEEYGVEVLGTELDAIEKAEDRDKFRELMYEIGEPVPESVIVHTVDEAVDFANEIGYPVVVRPAFTLGGTGGGFAEADTTYGKIGVKVWINHGEILDKGLQSVVREEKNEGRKNDRRKNRRRDGERRPRRNPRDNKPELPKAVNPRVRNTPKVEAEPAVEAPQVEVEAVETTEE